MEKFELSCTDVCGIINTCRGAGVSELTFSGLTLKFYPASPTQPIILPLNETTSQGPENVAEFHKESNIPPKMEFDLKQDELDHMMIIDPVAYEDLVISGDIDGRSDQDTIEA